MFKENYFIITGGPGMGKTAIIEALRLKGYTVVPESGRDIIREQVAAGGNALPWADRAAFAELMFIQAVADYNQYSSSTEPVFFDRGIADTIGYLQLCGLSVPEEMLITAKELCYHNKVFITPPWEEIFHQDAERKQSFEEAVRTYEMMERVYAALGYTLVVLPEASITERTRFILENR
jgi:Predicted ATPase